MLHYFFILFRENKPEYISNLWLKGLGIGNGFVSGEDQGMYADYFNGLVYLTPEQYDFLKVQDEMLLQNLAAKNYSRANQIDQETLTYFVTELMFLSNLYDFTFDGNFLTNNEYVCYLQNPQVRKAIHVGNVDFKSGGFSYHNLRDSVMVSKKEWLSDALGYFICLILRL